jgi:hypothetical protein
VRKRQAGGMMLTSICLAVAFLGSALSQTEYHMMPIHRLTPKKYHQFLPKAIVRALEVRGCKIPQPWFYADTLAKDYYRVPQNVIRGSFQRQGQVDWAVLCSCRDTSSILIFWGGRTAQPGELQRTPDENWTQNVDGRGSMGYSRFLAVAHPSHILDHNPDFKARHDGIEDAFAEKASVIYYFQGGRWIELGGAD